MTEPEVSLHLALYYIKNHFTKQDVKVSIDGAHIKTGKTIHFDIKQFMKENLCVKSDGDYDRWQGSYHIEGYDAEIVLNSVPGNGDVQVLQPDGKMLYVESKKGSSKKNGQEYPLMREAIGQLMTGCFMNQNVIPVVAVPYTQKSLELSRRWAKLEQIRKVGIRFILVKEDGNILMI